MNSLKSISTCYWFPCAWYFYAHFRFAWIFFRIFSNFSALLGLI